MWEKICEKLHTNEIFGIYALNKRISRQTSGETNKCSSFTFTIIPNKYLYKNLKTTHKTHSKIARKNRYWQRANYYFVLTFRSCLYYNANSEHRYILNQYKCLINFVFHILPNIKCEQNECWTYGCFSLQKKKMNEIVEIMKMCNKIVNNSMESIHVKTGIAGVHLTWLEY